VFCEEGAGLKVREVEGRRSKVGNGDWEIGRLGDWEIGRLGDWEIGDWEIGDLGRGGEREPRMITDEEGLGGEG
jgi:hypothetical protein